jgi:hypothetical protein
MFYEERLRPEEHHHPCYHPTLNMVVLITLCAPDEQEAPHLRHIVVGKPTYNIWPPVHWSPEGLAAFRARRPDVLISMVVC